MIGNTNNEMSYFSFLILLLYASKLENMNYIYELEDVIKIFKIRILFVIFTFSIYAFQPNCLNQVTDFLSDHNCRRVRVTPRNIGHDGRVYHPEPLYPINLQFCVHHCIGVILWFHFAGTDIVVNRTGVMTGDALPVLVAFELMLLTRR